MNQLLHQNYLILLRLEWYEWLGIHRYEYHMFDEHDNIDQHGNEQDNDQEQSEKEVLVLFLCVYGG